MEQGLRSRLVFLHLWCGVLSVAVIVMATMLIIITKTTTTSADQQNTTQKLTPNAEKLKTSPSATPLTTLQPTAPSLSYIQLTPDETSWTMDSDLSSDLACVGCSLVYEKSSIHCSREGLYLVYVHVLFLESAKRDHNFTVWKNRVPGKTSARSLFQISVSKFQKSVFVMKVASLLEVDRISIEINGEFSHHETFWGMIQLPTIDRKGHN